MLPANQYIGSLAKVYGAITFLLEHSTKTEDYLQAQDRRYEEIRARHPLPPEMIARLEAVRSERSIKRATVLAKSNNRPT
jgi:hypothetical protein